MRIDVHAHYWAGEYIDLLIDLGRKDLIMAGKQRDDLDERVAEMDSLGVEVQILSAIGLNTEVEGVEGATKAARFVNDLYKEVGDRYQGRFRAFGSVPLPYVPEAVAESNRCLNELRFSGIGLPCSVAGTPIDNPEFEPFWENLARHDAVVYVHPVGSNSIPHPGLAEWGLHTAYGSPLQIAVAAERIVLSGLSTRYPTLRFVFAMCGGILPFLWDRHERNLRRGLEGTAEKAVGAKFFAWMKDLPLDPADPMSGLRKFWYDTSTQDIPRALLCAKETYGVDRLLLGSDAIFASLTEAVHYIEESPYLSDEEKTAILDHNAEAMLAGRHGAIR